MKTKIYGSSDDLIEIEGVISEEIDCYNDTKKLIQCSDGTKAMIDYDGNWSITVMETGTLFDKIVLGNPSETPHDDPDAKGCSAYSDVIVLKEGIEWVKVGRKTYKP